MNSFKSLFKRNQPPLGAASGVETFDPGPNSPRYAYAFQSPFKRPRILILVDNVRATYFLSFHYVLQRVYETESLAFFVIDSAEVEQWTKEKTPEDFVQQVVEDVQPTVVIFSRYGVPHGDVLPGLFKQQKIATVCHIDDDLLNLNADLGAEIQKRQGDPVVQAARRVLLEQTDLIYASTAFLGDRFSEQFPQQQVFYGMYAPYLDFLLEDDSRSRPPNAAPTVGYMGSKGHQVDLDLIADEIAQVMSDRPDLRFETFGTIAMPAALQSFTDRVKSYKTNTDYAGFLNHLHQLNWDIGLAPLKDTEFNRCKAPTKYVEYTTCGIPTIASDGYVYEQFAPDEQIVRAKPGEWADKIRLLLDDESLRRSLVASGQAYCAQAFSLDVLEAQVKELLALV